MKMIKTTNAIYEPTYYGTTIAGSGFSNALVSSITPVNAVPLAIIFCGCILYGLYIMTKHGYSLSVTSGDTVVSFGPENTKF